MNFNELKNEKFTVFTRFTASWCKPCKAVEPKWEAIASNYPDKRFITIDVDEFDTIAAECGAIKIPYFVAFNNGEKVAAFSGHDEENLEKFVTSHSS